MGNAAAAVGGSKQACWKRVGRQWRRRLRGRGYAAGAAVVSRTAKQGGSAAACLSHLQTLQGLVVGGKALSGQHLLQLPRPHAIPNRAQLHVERVAAAAVHHYLPHVHEVLVQFLLSCFLRLLLLCGAQPLLLLPAGLGCGQCLGIVVCEKPLAVHLRASSCTDGADGEPATPKCGVGPRHMTSLTVGLSAKSCAVCCQVMSGGCRI